MAVARTERQVLGLVTCFFFFVGERRKEPGEEL